MYNKIHILSFLKKSTAGLENISEWSGKLIAWLVLFMVILVSYDVAMRYLFRSGSITLQELEWHLFSMIFLLGAAYTFKHNDHVRLDLFYQSHYMNDLKRAWVNIIGGVFFLVPFCLLVIISSWPFVSQSFVHMEGSPDPGGLPWRWLIKSAIPLGFFLMMLQGIADIFKNIVRVLEKQG
jgi:TRAP-type mannitol/chloroaromatic compound transport system permease small subunit